MSWLKRYHWKKLIRSSFWLYPLAGMLAAIVAAPTIRWLDLQVQWSLFNYSPDGARAIMEALASSMLTFFIFVLSSMVIVVQLASAQLTPRIISIALSKREAKITLGIFTFSYVFTLAVLGRVDQTVHQLMVFLAVVGNLAAIIVFVRFVYQFGIGLRPVAMLENVAQECRRVIESVYPDSFDAAHESGEQPEPRGQPFPVRIVEHTGASGVVLAFSPSDIIDIARKAGAIVEIVPQVGDFIAEGDPLFRAASEQLTIDDEALRHCIAIGPERTMEQDPRFAFRIMVDIANRALSPGINDPTTAVQALDQLHRMLMYVGKRRLDFGEVYDKDGKLRLIYDTPDWADYVLLAVSEVRHYGAGSIQVARRLHAMLKHLIRVLPEVRREPLRQELQLLHNSIERDFIDPRDRAMAEVSDNQGVGGAKPQEASQ